MKQINYAFNLTYTVFLSFLDFQYSLLMEVEKLREENKLISLVGDMENVKQAEGEKDLDEPLLEPLTTLEEFDEQERALEER